MAVFCVLCLMFVLFVLQVQGRRMNVGASVTIVDGPTQPAKDDAVGEKRKREETNKVARTLLLYHTVSEYRIPGESRTTWGRFCWHFKTAVLCDLRLRHFAEGT